ncbi:MAG: efflux RND transporter periplasmic adaptor subunit [Parabacteroides sp.]|nr:efflux RND transporter periplasmic adaptor subunit [Parabacteroides sp.]MDD4404822.1 efflux RND transporter periplasmic adaptor subunit [Parabacteroides sp.]
MCLSFTSCGKQGQNGSQMIKELAVVSVSSSNVELISSYPAVIKGKQDVEIRPQVSGFITRLAVDEGSVVRKGQTLFIIDPVQYEEAVNAARAAVNVAKANMATAELTAQNKRELAKNNIIGAYDLQMAENSLLSSKALLAQATAQLVNAEKNLSYTRVSSPSDGVVGTIPFRVGSLVSPSIVTPLTTVSDISEMYAYFSMTERQLLGFTAKGTSSKDILSTMPSVQLKLIDGTIYGDTGKVETMSGVIDQSTGSVSIRARFSNKSQILRSGGTGIVLVPAKMTDCIVIPQKATYEIQDKRFVYVVDDKSAVKSTPIEIFTLDDGQNFVVTSGLKVGDKIVVEGISSLKDGMQIKAVTPEQAAAKNSGANKPAEGASK